MVFLAPDRIAVDAFFILPYQTWTRLSSPLNISFVSSMNLKCWRLYFPYSYLPNERNSHYCHTFFCCVFCHPNCFSLDFIYVGTFSNSLPFFFLFLCSPLHRMSFHSPFVFHRNCCEVFFKAYTRTTYTFRRKHFYWAYTQSTMSS